MTLPRWRLTWWEGGPPEARQAVERTATVRAATAAAALAELDAELRAAGVAGYAPAAERVE